MPEEPRRGPDREADGEPGGQPGGQPGADPVSVVGLAAAFVFWPFGLPLSLVGLRRTRGARRPGRGLAVGGVVVSVVAALLWAGLLAVAVVRGEGVQEARGLPRASPSVPDGRTDRRLLPDVPVDELQDDLDRIRRQQDLMGPLDGVGLPVQALDAERATRLRDLRAQLRTVTCDGLADAVLAVTPDDASTTGSRLREVSGARPVQDTRGTFALPPDEVVAPVLACDGTARWGDGTTGGVRLELLVDADARLELSYRRLG